LLARLPGSRRSHLDGKSGILEFSSQGIVLGDQGEVVLQSQDLEDGGIGSDGGPG